MKKLLVLLTVMVGVFAFSAGALADPCSDCTYKTAYDNNIDCPTGDQMECFAFDYDASDVGYCKFHEAMAVFDICECDDPEGDFGDGQEIGIRMTILVDGLAGERGAYWSSGAVAQIPFTAYQTHKDACDDTGTNWPDDFGAGTFYKSNCTTVVAPADLIGDPTCAVPSDSQATVIVSDDGYTITDGTDGIITNQLSHWVIDIQPIRIDPSVLHNGEKISVKIELLNTASGGICAKCESVCECTIEVASVCCDATYGDELLFPYFTSLGDDAYWNGIVIDNCSSADGTATLTAYEKDGSVGTFTTPVIPAHSMFVDLLENIAWSGDGLGNAPCYIYVTTDFDADGFAMMADETAHDSMGYLPRRFLLPF